MKKEIELLDQKIEYTLKTSKRARRLWLSIYNDGRVFVTLPRRISAREAENAAEKFLIKKADWVIGRIERFKKLALSRPKQTELQLRFSKLGREDYLKNKEAARKLMHEKVALFNQFYGYKVGSIAIKDQKSRWGSCSRSGNLNFNYKIVFLTERQAEYIVVHELCHLGEFNHSPRFWKLVEKTIPDYRQLKAELKLIHISH
jgi:predicted metal-dependent hydrolase